MLQINWTEKSVISFPLQVEARNTGLHKRKKKKKDKTTSIKSPTTIRHKHTLVLCGRLRLPLQVFTCQARGPPESPGEGSSSSPSFLAQAPENNQVSHGRRTRSVPVSFCLKLLTCRLGRPTGETSQSHGQQCQGHRKATIHIKFTLKVLPKGLGGTTIPTVALKRSFPTPASTQIWNSRGTCER